MYGVDANPGSYSELEATHSVPWDAATRDNVAGAPVRHYACLQLQHAVVRLTTLICYVCAGELMHPTCRICKSNQEALCSLFLALQQM